MLRSKKGLPLEISMDGEKILSPEKIPDSGKGGPEEDLYGPPADGEEEELSDQEVSDSEDPEGWGRFQWPPDDETVPKSGVQGAPRVRQATISYNFDIGKWYCFVCSKYIPSAGCPRSRLHRRNWELPGRLGELVDCPERVLQAVPHSGGVGVNSLENK